MTQRQPTPPIVLRILKLTNNFTTNFTLMPEGWMDTRQIRLIDNFVFHV